jgi:hypothetical protein
MVESLLTLKWLPIRKRAFHGRSLTEILGNRAGRLRPCQRRFGVAAAQPWQALLSRRLLGGTSVGQSRATTPGNPFTGTVDVSQRGGGARDIRNRGTKPSRSNPDIVCRQSATNINTVRQIARDASAFFTAIGGVAGQPPPSITLSSGGRRLWSTGFMLHERIRDRHSDDGYSQ